MFSSSKKNIKAVVADNALVVSFLSADTPRVWRGDMSQFATSTVELAQADGKFSVVMKRGNGATEEICTYSDKSKAMQALEVMSDALLHGATGAAAVHTHKKGSWLRTFVKTIVMLAVIFFLLILWASRHAPHPPMDTGSNSGSSSTSSNSNSGGNYTPAPVQDGVPAPADQIIGK